MNTPHITIHAPADMPPEMAVLAWAAALEFIADYPTRPGLRESVGYWWARCRSASAWSASACWTKEGEVRVRMWASDEYNAIDNTQETT
ncbi:MAG: hypothetical protein GY772_27135 [bacterium]|nr:hypothetical protein [bacterium]